MFRVEYAYGRLPLHIEISSIGSAMTVWIHVGLL